MTPQIDECTGRDNTPKQPAHLRGRTSCPAHCRSLCPALLVSSRQQEAPMLPRALPCAAPACQVAARWWWGVARRCKARHTTVKSCVDCTFYSGHYQRHRWIMYCCNSSQPCMGAAGRMRAHLLQQRLQLCFDVKHAVGGFHLHEYGGTVPLDAHIHTLWRVWMRF
jgi:hypothetical protein